MSVGNSTCVCGKYYLGLLLWPQRARCIHSSFSSKCPNYTLVLQPTKIMLLQCNVKDVCLLWGLMCVRVPENTSSVWTVLKVLSACHNQHLCSCSRLDPGTCHATSCALSSFWKEIPVLLQKEPASRCSGQGTKPFKVTPLHEAVACILQLLLIPSVGTQVCITLCWREVSLLLPQPKQTAGSDTTSPSTAGLWGSLDPY